jgi:hypothetical protein
MKIPFFFTVTLLLASTLAFTVRPNLSIAKDKVSTGSPSGANGKAVHVHAGKREPSNPGLPFAFGLHNKTTPISVHPNISTLKENASLDSPTGAHNTGMHIHLEKNEVQTPSVVSQHSLPFTIALHNKTALTENINAVVIRKISNAVATAAVSGVMMWASILFIPSVPPADALPLTTSQTLVEISDSLKELKQEMDKNQQETNKILKELRRDQMDSSLKLEDLSSKVDRNQQDMSLKVAQLDLKIGLLLVDYKYFWIPIAVTSVNAISAVVQLFLAAPKREPDKPTVFSGLHNGTTELGPFAKTAGGLLHGAQNDSITKKNDNESA